ncbi:hypothetical protein D9M69_581430 [compost metagenome]
MPRYAHCLPPSSRVMMVYWPDALVPGAAISGGQLVAQGPLQALLPLLAVSRSKVYSVRPCGSVSTPLVTFTVGGMVPALPPPMPMPEQPASRTAAQPSASAAGRTRDAAEVRRTRAMIFFSMLTGAASRHRSSSKHRM